MQPKKAGKCDRCGSTLKESEGWLVCPEIICRRHYSMPPEQFAAWKAERDRRIRMYGVPWVSEGDPDTAGEPNPWGDLDGIPEEWKRLYREHWGYADEPQTGQLELFREA